MTIHSISTRQKPYLSFHCSNNQLINLYFIKYENMLASTCGFSHCLSSRRAAACTCSSLNQQNKMTKIIQCHSLILSDLNELFFSCTAFQILCNYFVLQQNQTMYLTGKVLQKNISIFLKVKSCKEESEVLAPKLRYCISTGTFEYICRLYKDGFTAFQHCS